MATAHFTVSADPDYGFIVHEASNAFSFAMIPDAHQWEFGKRRDALAQAEKLNGLRRSGEIIKVRLIETPERFEAVADTKYGPAW